METNQRDMELLRLGFNQGIKCAEMHPDNDDYDKIYFNRAISEAENLSISDVSESHVCKFYVNANWTGYSRCECGKTHSDNSR